MGPHDCEMLHFIRKYNYKTEVSYFLDQPLGPRCPCASVEHERSLFLT